MTATGLINSLKRFRASADAFAAGVRSKVERLAETMFGGRLRPGLAADQSLTLKDLLAASSIFDYEVQGAAPANPSWRWDLVRGWRWLWPSSIHLVALAAVDLDEIVRRAGDEQRSRQDWPPLSDEALDRALGELASAPKRTFVAVCSPSGFSDSAIELAGRRSAALAAAGGGLVLVRPRGDGGWVLQPFGPQENIPAMPEADLAVGQPWHFIFDPEPADGKIKRIRDAISAAAVDLADRGLSERDLAERLELPARLVAEVFADEVDRRSDLRLSRFDGELVLLARTDLGPSRAENNMSMFQKLRELLGLSGQERKKIDALTEKRALLNARRDRLYRELDELGEREQTLLQRGIATESQVMQRRLASELAQVRRRIEQGNTVVGLVNRQIDALGTHIHHLTLLTQGDQVEMPSIEEMTRDAVRAEELLERTRTDADVVESLAEVTGGSLSSVSEDNILAEFAAARQTRNVAERGQAERQGDRAPSQRASDRPVGDRPQRDTPMKE